MNLNRKIGIGVIILILIAITIIIVSPMLSNSYIHTSPSGEKFEFTRYSSGGLTTHVLTTYVSYKGDANNYKYALPFRYGPKQLEDISVNDNVNANVLNKKYIYITLNPKYSGKAILATIDLAKVLGTADYGVFKIPTEGALTYLTDNQTNLTDTTPIITCNQVTKDVGVIMLLIGEKNRAYTNVQGCVIIEALDDENLIKVADRVVYDLLGVM